MWLPRVPTWPDLGWESRTTAACFSHWPGLVASDGFAGQRLGFSVAISKDTAFVGSGRGAYVFGRTNETWTQQGGALGTGWSTVAMDGDTALVGTVDVGRGRVDALIQSGTTWLETGQPLVPAQPGGRFGISLALASGFAIIDDSSVAMGTRVLVFRRAANAWTTVGEPLIDVDGTPEDSVGTAVAASGNMVMVGNPRKSVGNNPHQGAVLAFGSSDCGAHP